MIELLKTQRVHDKILLAVQTRQIYTTQTQLVLINSLLEEAEALPQQPVGWLCLTYLFSTNTAISETKGQGWTVILLPVKEG